MSSRSSIPIVDMGGLAVGKKREEKEENIDEAEWQRVARELHDALSTVGFVYLTNHGIPETQISDIVNASTSFFKLDKDIKLRYNTSNESIGHGYMEVDREKLDKTGKLTELRESYYMKYIKGRFPDKEVPELRPFATTFVASCRSLAYRVLTALALGLGLDRDFFVSTHRGICTSSPPNDTVLRINHYPPVPSFVPENVIRCGAHTDYGSITLLFQDSMGGLQVRSVDGKWVEAHPIPGAVVVNAGDLLQLWTAGRIKATEHRVVIPKDEVRQQLSRFSAAFFVHPDSEVLVSPLDGSVTPPPITAWQHLINMYSKTYTY